MFVPPDVFPIGYSVIGYVYTNKNIMYKKVRTFLLDGYKKVTFEV
ncbi:MAG: hypothetical protein K0S18_1876 [Anaerocolumna sp.]|nr:hypothetical protein [Anaerocolumna sp.]